MRLAWGAKVDADFIAKLLEICEALGWSGTYPSWLMACMAFETAYTFGTRRWHSTGSATGLIGFMHNTAISLGTTVEDMAQMSPVEQLEYVRKYFAPYARHINTLSDMYMAILAPKAVGKPEDTVLYAGSSREYRANSPLDKNSDGKITKAEAAAFVYASLEKGFGYGNWKEIVLDEGTDRAIHFTEQLRRCEESLKALKAALTDAGMINA